MTVGKADNKGRFWKHMAIASLLLPVCGFGFVTWGPACLGRLYFWIVATLPIAGAAGGILAIAAIVGLRIRRISGWAWVCSILGLLASGAAVFFGAVGLFVATVFGPVYVSPSYITAEAGLARIPASASSVDALHRGNNDESFCFLVFTDSRANIEAFIRNSASIKQPPHAIFDANNTFTPRRLSRDEISDKWFDDRRYAAYLYWIEWFNPEVTVRGRQFDFVNGQRWGTVVVDDDKNKVYIFLSDGGIRPEEL